MGDLKARIKAKAKLLRRNSTALSVASANSDGCIGGRQCKHDEANPQPNSCGSSRPRSPSQSIKTDRGSTSANKETLKHQQNPDQLDDHKVSEVLGGSMSDSAFDGETANAGKETLLAADRGQLSDPELPLATPQAFPTDDLPPSSSATITTTTLPAVSPLPSINEHSAAALSTLGSSQRHTETKTPSQIPQHTSTNSDTFNAIQTKETDEDELVGPLTPGVGSPNPLTGPKNHQYTASSSSSLSRPTAPPRRQSLLPNRQAALIKALLNGVTVDESGFSDPEQVPPISFTMVTRKIWVRRPGASPTLVTINEDDLVDDVRDMILRKYANSLGRTFDAPDLTLRICSRDSSRRDKLLEPQEPMARTLDAFYPQGQTVDDALLVDIPLRRTPTASPNPRFYGGHDDRPHESGTDYFPPYVPAAHHPPATAGPTVNGALHFPPHSMGIIGNGQLPPLPSPGGTRRSGRPKMHRMHTASPASTVTNGHLTTAVAAAVPSSKAEHSSRTHLPPPEQAVHPPAAPPMPTPPAPDRVATPPPRVSSPRPAARPKKAKKNPEQPSVQAGLLNGGVPPINVLIVEDNIINLKLLEAFVKRLKVRWQTAMNGRDAVNKWRTGGFHLVLMDIQLPVMSGLEATREIRRLEKVNSIGQFSSSTTTTLEESQDELADEDKLVNTEMFKSPVIIVALTASSLQSDRHEALAAGCNDFLTKPVNFVWLERKVMEWGCMQALIDFDGWRKWKDFSQKAAESEAAKKAAAASKAKAKKNRTSFTAVAA